MKLILALLLLFPALAANATPAKRLSFAPGVEFAYRDAAATNEGDRRLVSIQGSRTDSTHFDSVCGAVGAECECLFYQQAGDSEPLRGTGLGISSQSNSLSCLIPGDHTMPDLVNFVSVRLRATGEALTPVVAIKTALTLDDVLGRSLDKNLVRGIFRYSCSRLFFEGEGVAEGSISCVPGQHLGLIRASYSFYTYRSGVDNNQPGGDIAYPGDICGRNDFLHVQCTGNMPELRYGFYRDAAGPFVVSVSLTASPAEGATQYGYAALPDSSGRCPVGLVKARPWVAQPASIVQGSLDGANPPSNFVNSNNQLNDSAIETAAPTNFAVTRLSSYVPCDLTGNCTNASFSAPAQVQSVAYTPLTPDVCVIPQSLLNGLF